MNTIGGSTREVQQIEALSVSQRAFKDTLFNTLVAQCSHCHGSTQGPLFATPGRPGSSHDAVVDGGLVDFSNRRNSLLVTRVRGGHNCFTSDCDADADIILEGITQWASRIDPESVPTGELTESVVIPAAAPFVPCNDDIGAPMTFDLREIDSSLPDPTHFRIRVRVFGDDNFEICDPEIFSAGKIHIADIKVIFNGAVILPNASWRNIDFTMQNPSTLPSGPATNLHGGTTGIFSPGSLIFPVADGPGVDELAFEIQTLEIIP